MKAENQKKLKYSDSSIKDEMYKNEKARANAQGLSVVPTGPDSYRDEPVIIYILK
ncbi:MAG: hypothetical protein ACT4ON_02030 [Bacteroidota bacterium]